MSSLLSIKTHNPLANNSHQINKLQSLQTPNIYISTTLSCKKMERPSVEQCPSFWLSPLNMIHLFRICVVPNSVGGVINKFISESKSFLKSLIPLTNTCSTIDRPMVLDHGDGDHVDGHDVAMMMEKMGLQCDPEHMIKKKMATGEVCRIFEEKEPSIEELKAAFDVFDCNGDGFIDAFELHRVIAIVGLGKGCDLEACTGMIRAFDLNGDDRIDAHEFFRFMTKTLC